jgi:23S rRNA pseudouridine2605 synthase
VNGKVVRELGSRVDADQSTIAVDGERIHQERLVYYAVNKPKGYVSTNDDPSGRPRVIDLLPEVPQRVYSVGRLDEESTGLMILTNDGELANRLAHPRFGVEKTYRALVAGTPSREVVAKLVDGIWLSDGKVRAKRARFVGTQGEATTLELVLAEGKKREIRRMLARLGHKVMSLNRIAIGPIALKGLAPGEHRPLSRIEIDLLRQVASGIAVSSPPVHEPGGAGRPSSRGSRRPQGRPATTQDRSPPPRSRQERPRHDRSPQAGPASAQSKPMPSPPASLPKAKQGTDPRAALRPGRRVIGLDPKVASQAGLSLAGRPPRKRPAIKRRPPRRVLGIKRSSEGDDQS